MARLVEKGLFMEIKWKRKRCIKYSDSGWNGKKWVQNGGFTWYRGRLNRKLLMPSVPVLMRYKYMYIYVKDTVRFDTRTMIWTSCYFFRLILLFGFTLMSSSHSFHGSSNIIFVVWLFSFCYMFSCSPICASC